MSAGGRRSPSTHLPRSSGSATITPRGYVTKSSPPDLLICAARDVAKCQVAICPEFSEALVLDRVQEERTQPDDLLPREFEILRMILDARSTDDIATALNVSRKTMANYHYSIKSKLGAISDIELVYIGLRQGLVQAAVPAGDEGP
jgi:DNA-binding NarL/FixJ family response regulator